jgi:hypothetical protein
MTHFRLANYAHPTPSQSISNFISTIRGGQVGETPSAGGWRNRFSTQRDWSCPPRIVEIKIEVGRLAIPVSKKRQQKQSAKTVSKKMSVESLKSQLKYSKKQTSYAWSQYYELQREEYNRAFQTVRDFEEKELEDEIPIGLNAHLQTMIQDLYKKAKEKVECAICLERISSDDLKTGKCGHNFHQACVDEWMKEGNKKCPLCRKKF